MRACLQAGVHYLDITAEINVHRLAEGLGVEATRAGVMLLPGVGWDVASTDCLALQLSRRVTNPVSMRIALQVAGSMSRGSAVSAGEIAGAGLMVRVNDALKPAPDASMFNFDDGDGDGDGDVSCFPLPFGDLVTTWHSTRIPNIAMFVNVTGDAFPAGELSALPDGLIKENATGSGPVQWWRSQDRTARSYGREWKP
ncbi:MAG: hypothetical protein PSV26_21190 [Polaromonas sp.]|uniref:hypothetical protein n=1 Tax=Polaromonas sp. TaxID=1869339 RepID=UPI00248A05CF|nr:hypothetical protein [Polaromonas sp.]MDI1240005.1 hypothetical protein [Polaromonas sp.]